MKGTLRPGRKAGVLALAVLLLTCVLMAGAVSADEEIEFEGGTCTIHDEGTYVLNEEATGNITIDAAGKNVTLTAKEGATLNGGIRITAAKNVTIEGMHINSTLISDDRRNLAIILPSTSIKLCLKNNIIEFAASGAESGSSVIATGVALSDESAIINNTILGVTAHVLNTRGVADDGTLTVQGNTVTMSPDEPIGLGEEKQGTGRALLKLFHGSGPNSEVNYIVADNVVTVSSDENYNATVVRVDKETLNPGKINVTMYNNTYNDNPASPYLYGGSIYGYSLGGLNITVSKTDETRILVPGLNQTGVVWSGGADAANQELELNESGSYKLMDAFTTTGSGIQITAGGVTLDGNDEKITTTGILDGYILKVAVDGTVNAEGVTLQKLDITGIEPSGTGNYGGVTVYAGEDKTSVPVTLKDSTIDMSGVTATDLMNPAVYFVSASDSEIANNVIKAGNTEGTGDGVTSRGIVIDGGSEITVSKNDVTMGTGAKVSIGIQFKNGPTDVTLAGNSITATNSDSEKLNRAIDITTLGNEGESYTITGTKLLAEDGASFESAVHVIVGSDAPENAELSLTTNGNDFSNVEKGIALVSWAADPKPVKLSGSINADDFRGISQENIIALSENLQDKVETDVDWTHDPEPSYSSSSGNMNNAYRVLFNDGSTTLSVQTDLSSGDKLTKPETPVKDGYTFAGWYKDSACTQAWDFETGISGDMTLYAKWTAAGSSGETEATATPTATSTAVTTPQPTKTQTAAATTSAPQATTAAGVSPTLVYF